MRWKAKNPKGTMEYYQEPYAVQHAVDGMRQLCGDIGHFVLLLVSKKRRMEMARAYNRAMFGNIPTEQIYVQENGHMRPLRQDERTWPE